MSYQCDGFAKEFQEQLTSNKISHQGQVLVLRRTPDMFDKINQTIGLNHAMGSLGISFTARDRDQKPIPKYTIEKKCTHASKNYME